jgi:S1-C subfamily serine protease
MIPPVKSGAALAAALFLPSLALAQTAPPKAPATPDVMTPAPQPATAAPAPRRPVVLTKLFMNMPAGQTYIDLKYGVFCTGERRQQYSGGLRVDNTNHQDAFKTEMEAAGIAAGRSDNIFGTNEDDVQYEVGAVITDEHLNACVANALQPSGDAKGDAELKIDWQVYSRLQQKVVLRVSTTGSANMPDMTPGGVYQLASRAFAQNARQLAANPDFRKIISEQAPAAGAVLGGSDQSRLALAGSLAAPARPISEAVGEVLVIANGEGSGSGFLVSNNGYVLTAAHVVVGAKSVKLRWSDGIETVGEVVRTNADRDVALIKTDSRGRPPLPLKPGVVTPGQSVYAIGAPLGVKFQGSVSHGVISATRVVNGFTYIQSDVSVMPGSSGGPLLDDSGHVLGLVSRGVSLLGVAPVGLNMFVPIGDALDFLSLDVR